MPGDAERPAPSADPQDLPLPDLEYWPTLDFDPELMQSIEWLGDPTVGLGGHAGGGPAGLGPSALGHAGAAGVAPHVADDSGPAAARGSALPLHPQLLPPNMVSLLAAAALNFAHSSSPPPPPSPLSP